MIYKEVSRDVTVDVVKSFDLNDKIYNVHETYVNNELKNQYFMYGKHNGYNPKNMLFKYYGGEIDYLQFVLDYWSGKVTLEPVLVKDLYTFSDFDNLYCNRMMFDGNCFRLTELDPLPIYKPFECWSNYFDIHALAKALESDVKAKNIKIQENCRQNYSISGVETLHFLYLLDVNEIKQFDKLFCKQEAKLKLIGYNGFEVKK